MARRATTIRRLEEHPGRDDVLAMLARLPHVSDADLLRLAARWRNDPGVAAARSRALSPDSPLVCEVLAAFDEVAELFEDDLRGEAPYVTLDPQVTGRALKSIRDALAGCYAGPILSRWQKRALLAPWKAVYPRPAAPTLQLGPQSDQVKALLGALPRLSRRCHDGAGQQAWEELADRSFVAEGERTEALEVAFALAVQTGRRRLWTLVRRTGGQLVGQWCRTCRTDVRPGAEDARRVTDVCLQAACGLLVADQLHPDLVRRLTDPVRPLLPSPGHAGSST